MTDDETVINATLYTNQSGWGAKETRWNGEIPYNDSGLVLLFHFNNETAGGENDTLVYDWSGNGNNGTMGNGDEHVSFPGIFGGETVYDGTGDYITVKGSQSINATGNLTISLWIKTDMGHGDQSVFAKGWVEGSMPPPYYQYALEIADGNDDRFHCYYGDGSSNLQGVVFGPVLSSDELYHVVCRWNGTHMTGFINGSEISKIAMTTALQPKDTELVIGSDAAYSQGFFGKIDEFAIWNRSLSNEEIAALYNYTKNEFHPVFQNVSMSPGSYEWNVLAYDNNAYSHWGGNYTFSVS